MKKISDATFYMFFSLVLCFFLLYFSINFRIEVERRVEHLEMSQCAEVCNAMARGQLNYSVIPNLSVVNEIE